MWGAVLFRYESRKRIVGEAEHRNAERAEKRSGQQRHAAEGLSREQWVVQSRSWHVARVALGTLRARRAPPLIARSGSLFPLPNDTKTVSVSNQSDQRAGSQRTLGRTDEVLARCAMPVLSLGLREGYSSSLESSEKTRSVPDDRLSQLSTARMRGHSRTTRRGLDHLLRSRWCC